MSKNNRFSSRALDECLQVPLLDKTERLVYQDTLRRFNTALASLSDTDQNLLHLRFYQELPVKEIADLYGLTITVVNRRLRRIDRKLEQSYLWQLAG